MQRDYAEAMKALDKEILELHAAQEVFRSLESAEFKSAWGILAKNLNKLKKGIHATIRSAPDATAHAYGNGQLYIIDVIQELPVALSMELQNSVDGAIEKVEQLKRAAAEAAAFDQEV